MKSHDSKNISELLRPENSLFMFIVAAQFRFFDDMSFYPLSISSLATPESYSMTLSREKSLKKYLCVFYGGQGPPYPTCTRLFTLSLVPIGSEVSSIFIPYAGAKYRGLKAITYVNFFVYSWAYYNSISRILIGLICAMLCLIIIQFVVAVWRTRL